MATPISTVYSALSQGGKEKLMLRFIKWRGEAKKKVKKRGGNLAVRASNSCRGSSYLKRITLSHHAKAKKQSVLSNFVIHIFLGGCAVQRRTSTLWVQPCNESPITLDDALD